MLFTFAFRTVEWWPRPRSEARDSTCWAPAPLIYPITRPDGRNADSPEQDSDKTSRCFWTGKANYYSLNVGGEINRDAIWYYADPKPAASKIRGRVAFWRGVKVID